MEKETTWKFILSCCDCGEGFAFGGNCPPGLPCHWMIQALWRLEDGWTLTTEGVNADEWLWICGSCRVRRESGEVPVKI